MFILLNAINIDTFSRLDLRPATRMRPVRQRTFCIPLLYLLACLAGCIESCHFACECEDDDDSDACDDLIDY
ncbi:hypothetical protein B9Z55_026307 [Caenorhabditis nigoni]|uniref:Uncharacterized protein n=1 Tax=Caenorhabditis nigoni TaxID=1611254 RepID=A0A2G5T262_9PELO|nr:hypothetical protein B9Z55_026307 [Caenorhabditis nigoni]